jgi:DNA-3-methyladenine glycosylase I
MTGSVSQDAGIGCVEQGVEAARVQVVGSTIGYAFMQAVAMVNDHLVGCFRYAELRNVASNRDD